MSIKKLKHTVEEHYKITNKINELIETVNNLEQGYTEVADMDGVHMELINENTDRLDTLKHKVEMLQDSRFLQGKWIDDIDEAVTKLEEHECINHQNVFKFIDRRLKKLEKRQSGPKERELSNCCGKPVKVFGDLTKHYRCTDCQEPCDIEEQQEGKSDKEYEMSMKGEVCKILDDYCKDYAQAVRELKEISKPKERDLKSEIVKLLYKADDADNPVHYNETADEIIKLLKTNK